MKGSHPITLALDVGGSSIKVFIRDSIDPLLGFIHESTFSSSLVNCLEQLLNILSDYRRKFIIERIFVGLPGDSIAIKALDDSLWCPPLKQYIDINFLRSHGCIILNDTELLVLIFSSPLSMSAPVNAVSPLITIGTSFGLCTFLTEDGGIPITSISSHEIAHSYLYDYVHHLSILSSIDSPILGTLFSVGGLFLFCYPDIPFSLDGKFIRVTQSDIEQATISQKLSTARLSEWFVLLSDLTVQWISKHTQISLLSNKPFLYSPAITFLSNHTTYSSFVHDKYTLIS